MNRAVAAKDEECVFRACRLVAAGGRQQGRNDPPVEVHRGGEHSCAEGGRAGIAHLRGALRLRLAPECIDRTALLRLLSKREKGCAAVEPGRAIRT